MSVRGAIECAMWTEIREALEKDYPDYEFPRKSGPHMAVTVRGNVDYIMELIGEDVYEQ